MGGKYKNFEMHNSQSPHSPGTPLGEADDKCILNVINARKLVVLDHLLVLSA